jgi:hypothetical protein
MKFSIILDYSARIAGNKRLTRANFEFSWSMVMTLVSLARHGTGQNPGAQLQKRKLNKVRVCGSAPETVFDSGG